MIQNNNEENRLESINNSNQLRNSSDIVLSKKNSDPMSDKGIYIMSYII